MVQGTMAHAIPEKCPAEHLDEPLPSFSIILETENLAQADLQGLLRSLACLNAQVPAPSTANEVWLIDSGDTPKGLLQQLCQQYPWLQCWSAPPGTEYYDAKMLGARQATGEVVVFYDSDCTYESHWLYQILCVFQRPGIEVVAGETRTRGLVPMARPWRSATSSRSIRGRLNCGLPPSIFSTTSPSAATC